jgi:hypothetical protein
LSVPLIIQKFVGGQKRKSGKKTPPLIPLWSFFFELTQLRSCLLSYQKHPYVCFNLGRKRSTRKQL